MDLRQIARDALAYARSWEPAARLLGNVTAAEVEALASVLANPWRPITQPPTEAEHAWCGGEYLVMLPSLGPESALWPAGCELGFWGEWMDDLGATHYLPIPPADNAPMPEGE